VGLQVSQRIIREQKILTNVFPVSISVFLLINLMFSTIISPSAEANIPKIILQSVSVVGNHLADQDGKPLRLLGVNKDGTEYACFQGWGITDGSFDSSTVIAMKSWGINAVRVPLNSACWLGRNASSSRFTGLVYRSAIADIVKLLGSQGIIAILDLHLNPTKEGKIFKSTQSAPNQDALVFWRSVAITFKIQKNIIFDLFNEPQGIDWNCWRNGCDLKDRTRSVGMQNLVDAIRATGSKAPIIFEANHTSSDFSELERYRLSDPLNQLIASNHNYQGMTGSNTLEFWNVKYLTVTKIFPLLTGELGQSDCNHDYVDKYMDWSDTNGISYLGWTWNETNKQWPCKGGHSLIADSQGTPSGSGMGFRNHFLNALNTTTQKSAGA
jgi:aryl-phospho-beta-D-glucosidase BglC (GH1 family)